MGEVAAEGGEVEAFEAPIVDGTLDSGHPSVGMVLNAGSCTGTLVGRQTVLTAAHCFVGQTAADTIFVTNGQIVNGILTGTGHTVDSIHRHPSYVAGRTVVHRLASEEYDLAILRLSAPSSVTPTPITMIHDDVSSPYTVGTSVTLVGYGITSTSGTNYGRKRMATNRIDAIFPAFYSHVGTGNGEGNFCNGDSGGPVLATLGGLERVLSVSSFGVGDCGAAELSARADRQALWLLQQAGGDLYMDSYKHPIASSYYDVNGDGTGSIADMLPVISYLRNNPAGVPPPVNTTGAFIDVNRDGLITTSDLLRVVQWLRAQQQ